MKTAQTLSILEVFGVESSMRKMTYLEVHIASQNTHPPGVGSGGGVWVGGHASSAPSYFPAREKPRDAGA